MNPPNESDWTPPEGGDAHDIARSYIEHVEGTSDPSSPSGGAENLAGATSGSDDALPTRPEEGAEPAAQPQDGGASQASLPDGEIDPEKAKQALQVAENLADIWSEIEQRAQEISRREQELQQARMLQQIAVTDPQRFLAIVGAQGKAQTQTQQKQEDGVTLEGLLGGEGPKGEEGQSGDLDQNAVQQLVDQRLQSFVQYQQAQNVVRNRVDSLASKVEDAIKESDALSWNTPMYARQAGMMFRKAIESGVVHLPSPEQLAQMTPQQADKAFQDAERAALSLVQRMEAEEREKLNQYLASQTQRQVQKTNTVNAPARQSASFVPGQHVRNQQDQTPKTVEDLIRMGDQLFAQAMKEQ